MHSIIGPHGELKLSLVEDPEWEQPKEFMNQVWQVASTRDGKVLVMTGMELLSLAHRVLEQLEQSWYVGREGQMQKEQDHG